MSTEAPPSTDEITVEEICEKLGRLNIATCLGLQKSAISNAIAAGVFPARWFAIISAMCREAGIACPLHLFAFANAPQPAASPVAQEHVS